MGLYHAAPRPDAGDVLPARAGLVLTQLLTVLAFALILIVVSGRIEDGQRRLELASCQHNDDQRAFAQLQARADGNRGGERLARRLLPILDCQATIAAGGAPVPLSPAEQERFLAFTAAGRRAIVRDGRVVVDARPPPAGR